MSLQKTKDKKPRFLLARLNHETNTFSPVPTPLEAFAPSYGDAAYRANKGMRTPMAAFIELAEAEGAELVTPVSAMSNPSGPVHAAAYDELTRRIVEAVPGCEAILLDLHGAMVAENSDDGEGDLLERVRKAAGPNVPIGVALDLHGNITEKMVRNADVMVGFKTYPHIDMYETGEHAGRLLLEMWRGENRYEIIWKPLPLMSHTLRSTTLNGPMKEACEQTRIMEQQGLPAVSVFGGFSLADIPAPCVSVLATVKQGTAAAQQSVIDAFSDQAIWQRRAEFVYNSEPLAKSLQHAQQLAANADKPVLLLDHGDNCMSGGTCDTMDVLEAALQLKLDGIAVGPLCDPQAVAQMFAAGEGAVMDIALGNKRSLAHLGMHKQPLQLRGTVRQLGDGKYIVSGPIYNGMECHMGRTALLDIGAAQIVVTEQPHEPWDQGVFHCVSLDPTKFRYLLLKSRMYCRPVFVPLSAGLVECDSPGVTTSDYSRFEFKKVNHPVYPLDKT